jgi:hypothetical protein
LVEAALVEDLEAGWLLLTLSGSCIPSGTRAPYARLAAAIRHHRAERSMGKRVNAAAADQNATNDLYTTKTQLTDTLSTKP